MTSKSTKILVLSLIALLLFSMTIIPAMAASEKTITVYPGGSLVVNGENLTGAAPELFNYEDRLYLPLRYAAEAVGASIAWDSASQTATVTSLEKTAREINLEGVEDPTKLLIVIDIQNDFVTGTLGTKEAEAILPKVQEKIKNWDGKILFTMDTHYENYLETQEGRKLPVVHCARGTWGWEIAEAVKEAYGKEIPAADIFEKETFGSIDLWNAVAALNAERPIEEIQVIGLVTDICVASNSIGLRAAVPETEITVDAACVAGVTPEAHETALDAIAGIQINVINRD